MGLENEQMGQTHVAVALGVGDGSCNLLGLSCLLFPPCDRGDWTLDKVDVRLDAVGTRVTFGEDFKKPA
jgi:hypothetical protein